MTIPRAAAIWVALGAWVSSPAAAAIDPATLERAIFRTMTLNYDTAPRETIAAAAGCAVAAARALPNEVQDKLVEIDKRPVYTFNDRLRELVEALYKLDDKVTQPFVQCFDRLGAGEFGPTKGSSMPATAMLNSANVPACPIDGERVRANEVTCYCQPLLGGVAYGYKTYSDLSSICLAARHSGVFDYLTGGIVKVAFRQGCSGYESAAAHGYESGSRGRSARSFHFPSVGPGKCPI